MASTASGLLHRGPFTVGFTHDPQDPRASSRKIRKICGREARSGTPSGESISLQEMVDTFTQTGKNWDMDDVKNFFELIDLDKSGEVDYEEFMSFIHDVETIVCVCVYFMSDKGDFMSRSRSLYCHSNTGPMGSTALILREKMASRVAFNLVHTARS